MMDSEIDDTGRMLDPEAEVRKLQKLVAKLTEERNLYLKNNGNIRETQTQSISMTDLPEAELNKTSHDKSYTDNANSNISASLKSKPQEKQDDNIEISLDDVDLLDIDSLENIDEEDSWLYTSPVKLSPSEKSVSPYKWVREEFERPDLQSAGRSILFKLDELARAPHGSSAPSSSSEDLQSHSLDSNQEISSTGSMPFIRKPLMGLGSRVDTSTFTRPKKRGPAVDNMSAQQVDAGSPRSSPRNTPETNNNAFNYHMDENANSGASSGSQESLGTTHRLADVTDVQVLARMQEDSLRQSFNAPRKSLSQSLNRSMGGLLEGDSASSSNRSSPGRFDSELYQSAKRSNNSLGSLSSNSTNSPPTSPYSSQYFDQKTQAVLGSDRHRSSLPNLTRGAGVVKMPSPLSDPRQRERGSQSPTLSRSQLQPPARDHHSRASPNRQLKAPDARFGSPGRKISPSRQDTHGSISQRTLTHPGNNQHRIPSPQRQSSPAYRQDSPDHSLAAQRTASPARTVSPQRSGIRSPVRTGIPRPGSASKLPGPRRSSIPSPRRPMATPDDSWKDGCF